MRVRYTYIYLLLLYDGMSTYSFVCKCRCMDIRSSIVYIIMTVESKALTNCRSAYIVCSAQRRYGVDCQETPNRS